VPVCVLQAWDAILDEASEDPEGWERAIGAVWDGLDGDHDGNLDAAELAEKLKGFGLDMSPAAVSRGRLSLRTEGAATLSLTKYS